MTSEEPTVQRFEHRCMRRYKFDQISAGLNNNQEEGTRRTARRAPEYPMVVDALAGGLSRDIAGARDALHKHRKNRKEASVLPPTTGCTDGRRCNGQCLFQRRCRNQATKTKAPVEPMQAKAGCRFNRWLRKFLLNYELYF